MFFMKLWTNLAVLPSVRMFSGVLYHSRKILSSAPFTKHLLLTNVAAGCLLDSFGDSLTQRLVEHVEQYDWKRTARMGIVGLVFAPPYHYWYLYLERKFPTRTWRHMGGKVGLDIFIAGPICIALFYLGINISNRSIQLVQMLIFTSPTPMFVQCD